MPVQWKKTRFVGVRFYEHPTRKHGIGKDRYFAIRYQREGKRIEEGLGWGTDGWTAENAAEELALLKRNARKGEGPTSLQESRDLENARKAEEARQQVEAEQKAVTFEDFFDKTYFPTAKTHKKPDTIRTEKIHFELWLKPVIGALPFSEISPFHIERIKKNLLEENKSPRTAQYVLATFRQIWNAAKTDGIIYMDAPSKKVKVPKFDNKRHRFLTRKEADRVLKAIKAKKWGRGEKTYQISLFALHTGGRPSEIFNLRWGDVDLENGVCTFKDSKTGDTRHVLVTDAVKKMLSGLDRGKSNELVFPARGGGIMHDPSNLFQRVVDDLGFNDGVEDRRHKVTFYTLRHTFASWHVMAGTDIRVLQRLMGHKSISTTMRYGHVGEPALKSAMTEFERVAVQKKKTSRLRKVK